MTTILLDAFDGSAGSVNGRTPDTAIGAVTWVSTAFDGLMNLDGAGAIAPTGPYGNATYGDGSTDYGTPTSFNGIVGFTTPTDLSEPAPGYTSIVMMDTMVKVGAETIHIYIKMVEGDGQWRLCIDNLGYGVSLGELLPDLAFPNTEYTITFSIADGAQTAELLTTTATGTEAYITPALGVNQVNLYCIDDANFTEITLETPAAPVYDDVLDATMPVFSVEATASSTAGMESLVATLPVFAFEGYGAASLAKTMPSFAVDAAGTVWRLGALDAAAAVFAVEASGTTPGTAGLTKTMPAFTVEAFGGGQFAGTMPVFTIEAAGTVGSVATLVGTLPVFEVEADGSAQDFGALDAQMPGFEVGPYAQVQAVMPAFVITATGSAIVSVTYEAYALNLKHATKNPVDELTRYTNFPFTAIVRFRGAYYGVGAAGLYRLTGTTDYADPSPTPIPWAWKTGVGDFGNPAKKTISAVYFGGRMPAAATVTLYAGEDAGTAYSHTNPRGSDGQNYRQKFGKGVKDRYYAVGASGTGAITLDNLEFDIAQLTRRI